MLWFSGMGIGEVGSDPKADQAFRFARMGDAPTPARLREILSLASAPGVISFAVGLPSQDLFPIDDLAKAQARVLANSPEALQYTVPYLPLKRQIVELMALRGVSCGVEQVFLTSGSQQGMDLLSRLFVDPAGDVLLEETVYDGIRLAVSRHGARQITVATDLDEGLDVDGVEDWLGRGVRPQLLYAIPSGHNPLGVSLSADRRRRLVSLAREHGFPVLEDDAYGFLSYEDRSEPPLKALEERWVFYLGSFSKILAPALRTGWLVVPEELIPRLSALKHATDLDTPSIGQRIISSYLEVGTLKEHLASLRIEYRRRRDLMLESLAAFMPPGVDWTRPNSGMFVWISLPTDIDAADLLPAAIERDLVAFSPGQAFSLPGSRHADHCLRLCFTCGPPDQLVEGVRRLAQVVGRALDERPRRT